MEISSSLPTNNIAQLVDSYITSCRNRGLSKHTLRWYGGVLKTFDSQFITLPDTPEQIEAYIASYQAGDERRHGVYRIIRAFYNFTEVRHDTPNPMNQVKPPKVKAKAKQALTIEQLRQLLNYPGHNPMTKALLYLLSDTGIRLGEAAGITGKDISPGSLKVDGKTGERIIPISPEVHQLLLDIMPVSTVKDQRLFPYETHWLGQLASKAIKASGLSGFSAHSLRHTFCTWWNGSDTALKHITGHRSWQMIERYKHQREAQASEQHREHSPLARLNGEDNGKASQSLAPLVPQNNDIHPDSIQLTGKTDDISAILRAFPHKDCDHYITSAKYYFHAALYNAGRQLLKSVTSHIEHGTIKEFMGEPILEMLSLSGEIDLDEDSDEKIRKAFMIEAKKLLQMEQTFLEGFVAEQYDKALIYKRLAGEEIGIEEVTMLTSDYYSLEISN